MARAPPVWLLVSCLLSLTLAGCAGKDPSALDTGQQSEPGWMPGPATPRPDYDFEAATVPTHDHSDPGLHGGAFNIEQRGYSPIVEASDALALPGGHAEIAVALGYAFVANWGPHRGFSIIDVSDPSAPRHVSDFLPSRNDETMQIGAGSFWDVSVTADSNLTILSAQALANAPIGGREDEHGGGVYLVNTEDKAAPFFESFTQVIDDTALIPVGVHNARPFEVGSDLFVAATTANGRTHVLQVVGPVGLRTLEPVSIVAGMHDTTVQVHPLTGETYIYGAQGGMYITDITDPWNPVVISVTPNSARVQAYHQVVPNNVLVDGRHFTVTATESAQGDATPFSVLDTTDPYNPVPVGQWILPGTPSGQGQPYRFSGHNFDFHDGRIYIGHYHAGVWVVDLSSAENAADPFAVGYILPHGPRAMAPRTAVGVDVPSVWAVVVADDGLLYASDVNTGLYVLEYTGPPSPLAGAPSWPINVR